MHLLNLVIDETFLDKEFYGEKVTNYLWFAGIVIGTLFFKRYIAGVLTWLTSRISSKSSFSLHKKKMRSLLLKPIERLLQIILFFVAINQLTELLDRVVIYHSISKKGTTVIKLGDFAEHVFLFLFIIFLTQVLTHIIDFIYYLNFTKAQEERNQSKLQLMPLMKELSKLAIWLMSIFWTLGGVFHVNVPALITGLGIGGVAIALAGKETVENFIAAFTILTDKPFKVGDHVKLMDVEGLVERIGFRSTRIRGFGGAEIIIPNNKLVSQNLMNLTSRDTQGMKLVFNIRYGITEEKLTQLINAIKDMLHASTPVKEPIDILIETFNIETLQLIINYHLPQPLPSEYDFITLRNEISLKLYGLICGYAQLGSPEVN